LTLPRQLRGENRCWFGVNWLPRRNARVQWPRRLQHDSENAERQANTVADMRSPLPAGASDGGPDRRRSHRVQIAMGIIVRGASGATNFSEEVQTISVNAHGCMVRLAAKVARGQQVTIINTKTVEELTCSVTFVGQTDGAKTEVGLEFSEPSPVFWRIAFPPEDWDPSERKRASTTRSAPPAKPVKK
jgi:hypothetical protein